MGFPPLRQELRCDELESLRAQVLQEQQRASLLLEALRPLTAPDCVYSSHNLVIPCESHAEAISLMRNARAAVKEATR